MHKPFKKSSSPRPANGRNPKAGFKPKTDGFTTPKRIKPTRSSDGGRGGFDGPRPERPSGGPGNGRFNGPDGGRGGYSGGDRPQRPAGGRFNREGGGGYGGGDRPQRPAGGRFDRDGGGGYGGGDRPQRPAGGRFDREGGGGYGSDRPRRFSDRGDDRGPRRSFDRPERTPYVSPEAQLETILQRVVDILDESQYEVHTPTIEALAEEYEAGDIAAALLHLLLQQRPNAPHPGARREERPRRESGGRAEEGMTRLFVNMGRRDGLRPGDLVGAIAGEAGIDGKTIGVVDIMEEVSFVEVPSGEAENVIGALSNATMRGQKILVDYAKPSGGGRDRGGDRPRHRPRY